MIFFFCTRLCCIFFHRRIFQEIVRIRQQKIHCGNNTLRVLLLSLKSMPFLSLYFSRNQAVAHGNMVQMLPPAIGVHCYWCLFITKMAKRASHAYYSMTDQEQRKGIDESTHCDKFPRTREICVIKVNE